MTRRLLLSVTAAAVVGSLLVSAAQASCIPRSAAYQRAHADVIFDGVALEGPTETGVQRFRVTRYYKSKGPRLVRVQTGTIERPNGTGTTTSVSLYVKRGERWRIFARGSHERS
jgi:hypothetical protein